MTDDEIDNMSEEELIAKIADMTESINKLGRELSEHIFESLKAWLETKAETGELNNMNNAVFGIALGTVIHSGGFTTGTPWEPFAPGRETGNVATESADPRSLLSRYRDLIHLRASTPALRTGSYAALSVPQPASVLAFVREAHGSKVLVAHNLGASAAEVATIDLDKGVSIVPLWADPGAEVARAATGRFTLRLPPGASGVWGVRCKGVAAPALLAPGGLRRDDPQEFRLLLLVGVVVRQDHLLQDDPQPTGRSQAST